MKIVLDGILFIPRLVFFIMVLLVVPLIDFLYKKIHRIEIRSEKIRQRALEVKLWDLQEICSRHEEEQKIFKEIDDQLQNGKTLLGIHRLSVKKASLNSFSVQLFYFMYHKKVDSDTFYIRAHFAGQITKYRKERETYFVQTPEDQDYVFRIEGSFSENTKSNERTMSIHHLDTHRHFRNKGIATIGIEYVKELAINKQVRRISGMMDRSDEPEILRHFYRQRGFEVLIPKDSNENDGFRLLFDDIT